MKLWDIAKKIGGGLLKEAVPGAGILIDLVNDNLDDKDKLSKDSTGADLAIAIDKIPADKRAELMGREFDVQIVETQEQNATLRIMLEADTKNPHTTRPKIAYQAFQLTAAVTLIMVSLWAYGVATGDEKLVGTVMDGWPFVLSLIGPFLVLLHGYFGILREEHRNKLAAVGGHSPVTGVATKIYDWYKSRK